MIGDYEAEERELIRSYLRPEDSVLELGACIGAVSCTTNKLLADKSRHVVLEANPKLIPMLEHNRNVNGCGFTVLNRAASQEKSVTFYLTDEFIVGGTTHRVSQHPVTVEGSSLEALDREFGPFTALVVVWETHDWACGVERTEACRRALADVGLKYVATAGDTEAWVRPD